MNDRAGYWQNELLEDKDSEKPGQAFTRRIYLFTATGLREATKGHDFRQVLNALDAAGAFARKDLPRLSVSVRTPKGKERLYHVDPQKL